ncbi:MAG: hypothetical protein KA369_08450 [Spirochaetes bacterium]|nr:hypothetical protein [Spirochaetota bacterium]
MIRYSPTLKQDITIDHTTHTVTTADGTTYTAAELEILKGQPSEVLQGIHKIKKAFKGEVIHGAPA